MLFLHHSRNICFVLAILTTKKQQRSFNFRQVQLAVRTDTLCVQAVTHSKGSKHDALAHTSAHRLLQLVGPFSGYGKRKQRDNKLLNRSEFVQFNVLNYMK